MLNNENIDLIVKLLTIEGRLTSRKPYLKPDDSESFKKFLKHIDEEMILNEQADIKSKIAKMTATLDDENLVRISDLSVIKEIKGEFEFSLKAILECVGKRDYEVVCHFIGALQGAYWETMFCYLFAFVPGIGEFKKGVHRFQKWQRLGAGRLADGTTGLRHTAVLPDVLFTIQGQWVMAEIKHETPTTKEHPSAPLDCYGMSEKDYERIRKLSEIKPSIPYWFIVHDHTRIGKWSIESEPIDWLTADFRKLGKPIMGEGAKAITSWSPEPRAYWSKNKFNSLDDALRALSGIKLSTSL